MSPNKLNPGAAMDAPDEMAGVGGRFRSSPHPALRSFVVEYWGIARDLAAMGGFTITPDCFGELICCGDAMFAVVDGRREKLPPCFLVGLLDGPLRVEAAGVVRCLSARLRPWAVGPLSETGPASPTRGWSDAGRIFGPRLAIASELARRCEWPTLTDLFDEILMDEINRWDYPLADIEVTGQFLGAGQRPTSVVARERRITGRQIERRVRKLTRTSPKQLACLSRFQAARDAIWADPAVDLARLAIASGYSDQSHLTRQFRRYSGQTPAEFARGSASKKKWLAAQDVAFVQEGGSGGG